MYYLTQILGPNHYNIKVLSNKCFNNVLAIIQHILRKQEEIRIDIKYLINLTQNLLEKKHKTITKDDLWEPAQSFEDLISLDQTK